jgi:hypothetical protein
MFHFVCVLCAARGKRPTATGWRGAHVTLNSDKAILWAQFQFFVSIFSACNYQEREKAAERIHRRCM